MRAISERDTAAMLDIVHDGAVETTREAFPSSVLSALARLIPSDAYVGYQEADVSGPFRLVEQVEVVGQPLTRAVEDAFDALGWQNPMHCRLHARNKDVLRLSDVLPRFHRRALAFNTIVWQPLGIDDALRLWIPAEDGRARSIYLERSGMNYTDRELTLFFILRPHLIRMHANADSRHRFARREGMTPREAEVLGWVARGKTNNDIAGLLFISPHTVRKHVENIFEKLDVRTRTAAAQYASNVTPNTSREPRIGGADF